MVPQPFSRRFQGDNQVDDPGYPQSRGDKIETSNPPSRKSSPNASLVPRGATTFHISRMVTGLVTVNGNMGNAEDLLSCGDCLGIGCRALSNGEAYSSWMDLCRSITDLWSRKNRHRAVPASWNQLLQRIQVGIDDILSGVFDIS